MKIQKQILNQSKSIPPGYTLQKDPIKKITFQALRERNCSVKGAEQLICCVADDLLTPSFHEKQTGKVSIQNRCKL